MIRHEQAKVEKFEEILTGKEHGNLHLFDKMEESLDQDVLAEDYPHEMLEEELRDLGANPEEIRERGRLLIRDILKEQWQTKAQMRKEQMKMNYRLLNSAMMPAEGQYQLFRITEENFASLVKKAHKENALVSYIGYPDTAQIIQEISGVKVEVSRAQTQLFDGDRLLIIRLDYRVNPNQKGRYKPHKKDFSFWLAQFYTHAPLDEPGAKIW